MAGDLSFHEEVVMDRRMLALVVCAVLPSVFAGDADRPQPADPATAARSRADDATLARMQQHMRRMRDTTARIQETTHPDERQELLDRHAKEMQDGMRLMREHEKAMEDGFRQ
jgi:hypothetical protein